MPYFLAHPIPALKRNLSLEDKNSLYLANSYGRLWTKVLIKANHPSCLVYKNTIPHRLTVAGEAWDKSYTSNIIVIQLVSLIIYPLVKQSFLLSSKTVFIFSIHTASTGPSNMTHFLSYRSASSAHFLMIMAATPSDQLFVLGSNLPYNWSEVIDLGLSLMQET